jgi:DNA-binding HxlR family transcriptional regulator
MPGVTIKVLRQQLRQLEADGLIMRSQTPSPRLSVRYELTDHGHTLGPVFEILWTWGAGHLAFLSEFRPDLRESSGPPKNAPATGV